MRFNLVGPFEIVADDGRVYRPGTPKVCQTLALLLTRPGGVVTTESLIEELWGDRPPRSATTTLQTYVYHSRRMLINENLVPEDRQLIVTSAPGYSIQVDEDEVDAKIFERLVAQARRELADGQPESALRTSTEALDLWRGPVLSGSPAGSILAGHIVHLEELRIRAYEIRIEAEERLGRYRESIPELCRLISDYPLNEWFHSQLISALGATGRRAEALQAYQSLRKVLADELGLEPSPELQQLQLQLLTLKPLGAPGPDRLARHGEHAPAPRKAPAPGSVPA
ncbi:AfsR/SARP family transcriptional regulator [Streptomyces cavernicola]|uniref:AfsR/SARP family transcriptional regulator n=1 Tax=Streptomyces cavernicola TaxID=3043613 RepID=A0ABT6SJX6_9ACTN|nr:AfsR/SARP family transcriptional regulator [Streptomyces sp. B-S-A6]MDI3408199.1 AfsR/SARP family transcriptional regulator [Streptomyces sp. B-S-A6]